MQGLGALPPDVRARIAHLSRYADQRGAFTTPSPVRPTLGPETSWRRLWHFEGASGAERWNQAWEQVIERPAALHPALIQIGGAAIRDPLLDALARIAATVLCDEIRTGSPYPFVRPGGSYALEVERQVWPFPLPRFERSLVLVVRGEVYRADGQPLWSAEAAREIPYQLVPASVVALWSERAFAPTEETYA